MPIARTTPKFGPPEMPVAVNQYHWIRQPLAHAGSGNQAFGLHDFQAAARVPCLRRQRGANRVDAQPIAFFRPITRRQP